MTINYVALANEITLDPTSRGYAIHVTNGSDNQIAELLNEVIVNNKVNTGRISSEIFKRCIPLAAFTGLTTNQQNWLRFISETNYLDLNDNQIKNGLLGTTGLFPSTSTGANLTARNEILAASERDGSRAEKLFGVNTFITDMDVARALRPEQFATLVG